MQRMIVKRRATRQSTIYGQPDSSFSVYSQRRAERNQPSLMTRAISRTLNARYQAEPYGLGPNNAATTYPVSAFVTHMVHLRSSAVHVDAALISVRRFRALGLSSLKGESDSSPFRV